VFGGFLECREAEQIAFGTSIAALAAGAAGVAGAGVSTVAATSLAGAAGAGLGLDYILYNKAKTKAYADAVAQLQCVIAASAPLKDLPQQVKEFLNDDYSERLSALRNFKTNFPRYLKNQRYPATKRNMTPRAVSQENCALLAACESDQDAFYVLIGGVRYNGVFTHFLIDSLKQSDGLLIPLNVLMGRVQKALADNDFGTQTPRLRGPADLLKRPFLRL